MPTGLGGRSGLLCTRGHSACGVRAQHSSVAQRSRFHPAPSACLQTRVLPEIENPPSSKHAMLKRRTAPGVQIPMPNANRAWGSLWASLHTRSLGLRSTGSALIGRAALSVSPCTVGLLANARAAGDRNPPTSDHALSKRRTAAEAEI